MAILLRVAGPDDAEGLARLHDTVWHETYRDLAPAEAVSALNFERRLTQWRESLRRPAPQRTLIAERDGEALGLVCTGAPSQPVFGAAGEIKHLYVTGMARGCGTGRQLLQAGLAALKTAGFEHAALAVVEDNHAARAFYAREGGLEGARFVDEGPLWRSRNILVRFDLA